MDRMNFRFLLPAIVAAMFLACLNSQTLAAGSTAAERVVILRERASVDLLDGALTLELKKIRGYTIDVRIDGKNRKLKRGETFSPDSGVCSVTFLKVSPETRIARFLTDCP